MKAWKPTANDTYYYWIEDNGLIIGTVHNVFNTTIWLAKISSNNDDAVIGRYITCDFAKRAVEQYWNIQERTLPNDTNS